MQWYLKSISFYFVELGIYEHIVGYFSFPTLTDESLVNDLPSDLTCWLKQEFKVSGTWCWSIHESYGISVRGGLMWRSWIGWGTWRTYLIIGYGIWYFYLLFVINQNSCLGCHLLWFFSGKSSSVESKSMVFKISTVSIWRCQSLFIFCCCVVKLKKTKEIKRRKHKKNKAVSF